MGNKLDSVNEALLREVVKNPETPDLTRKQALKSLGDIQLVKVKIKLAQTKQAAREKAQKDAADRKSFGI
jgi:hypothetical protein